MGGQQGGMTMGGGMGGGVQTSTNLFDAPASRACLACMPAVLLARPASMSPCWRQPAWQALHGARPLLKAPHANGAADQVLTRQLCPAAGMQQPQENYEKKTHSTHDHDESESHEVCCRCCSHCMPVASASTLVC
jgi:hypothetical protein